MPEAGKAARATILERIRAANADADALIMQDEYETIPREYQRAASMDRPTILAVFAERLRDYDATVHEAANAEVGKRIPEVLAARGQDSAVVADDFPGEWLSENRRWRVGASADVETLSRAEGAIVACEVAIAHTGTIVLRGSRKLTLLPDHLLVVVREEQVVETVPEAMERLQPFAAEALTFVSGPSATADIEMTRIRGVHGPRFLDVVLVKES